MCEDRIHFSLVKFVGAERERRDEGDHGRQSRTFRIELGFVVEKRIHF